MNSKLTQAETEMLTIDITINKQHVYNIVTLVLKLMREMKRNCKCKLLDISETDRTVTLTYECPSDSICLGYVEDCLIDIFSEHVTDVAREEKLLRLWSKYVKDDVVTVVILD